MNKTLISEATKKYCHLNSRTNTWAEVSKDDYNAYKSTNPSSVKIVKDGNCDGSGRNQNQNQNQNTQPAQATRWDSYPCVRRTTGVQINGDVATLEQNGVTYTMNIDGTFTTNDPKIKGSWLCDSNNVLQLKTIEDLTPDSKVTTTVTNQLTPNATLSEISKQVTEYGRFNFFQKSKDGMIVNRLIIDQAVDEIVDLIGNQYRGIYFDQFRYSLQTIKDEYCDKYSDTIPSLTSDSTYLEEKIKEIVDAKTAIETTINNVTTNLSLAKTGKLRSFRDPADKEYYNELKLSTISPWDKYGIGAENISIWQRSDVGTKTTERTADISNVDKYIQEHSGTTEGCLTSVKELVKLIGGCTKYDPKSQLGICTKEDRQSYSESNDIDVRGIKQTINLCNNKGLLNEDQLIEYISDELIKNIVKTPDKFGFPSGSTAEDRKVKKFIETQAPLRAAAYRNIINDLRNRAVLKTATSDNGHPIRWQDQPMQNEQKNIDMKLKNTIRKTLVETKENKKRLIQESRIVENRFNFILESKEIKTKKDYNNFLINVLSEMVYLHKQGFDDKLIAENADNLFGALGNIFGGGANSVMATFKEKGVNWILNKLGMGDNSVMKNFMISAIGNTDLKDIPKLFTDCDFLTKKIAESVPEAFLRKLQHEKGLGGNFADVIRNSLYDVVRTSNFAEKIEEKIGEMVCPLVNQISGIFGNKLDSMKSSLISPQQ